MFAVKSLFMIVYCVVLCFSWNQDGIGESDFLQDVNGRGSPHEWYGILVMHDDVLLDSEDRSGAQRNMPRRKRSVAISRKKRSTMFSHDAEVGAKFTMGGDRTVEGIERRERGRGAVTLVVMSLGRRTASLQGQSGLSTVKCLHLALLVAAQNQRMLGRRHVQAHDVLELIGELQIPRAREALEQVMFESEPRPTLFPARRRDAG